MRRSRASDFDAASGMCHDDLVFYAQIDTPRAGADGFIAAEKKHLDVFRQPHPQGGAGAHYDRLTEQLRES